jgi:hypothetical protein
MDDDPGMIDPTIGVDDDDEEMLFAMLDEQCPDPGNRPTYFLSHASVLPSDSAPVYHIYLLQP